MQTVPERGAARIVRVPGICGGAPTVAGTRIPVRSVVVQWKYYRDFDQVMRAFPRLDVPAIQAALAFYEDHREEIDQSIEENERAAYSAD